MGNNEFSISPNIRAEWREKNSRGKRVFYNKITLEEFELMILSKEQIKCGIAQLVQRSIYPLGGTPKVIILNDNSGEVSILVQRSTCSIKTLFCEIGVKLQLLLTIRQIVRTLHALFLRFGPFAVGEQLLGGTEKGEPLAWIHSSFHSNHIQNPLPRTPNPEYQMTAQIIALCKKLAPLSLSSHIFSESSLNFSRFIQGIEAAIQHERKCISPQAQKWKPVAFMPHRSFSPKNTVLQVPFKYQSHKRVNGGNNIPNFIKKNKQETPHLVKVLSANKLISAQAKPSQDNKWRRERSTINQENKIDKVRSLNCSPEPTHMTATLKESASTANGSMAFASQSKLDRLASSRQSVRYAQQTTPSHNKLEIPLINSFSSKELPGVNLIREVEEENTYREVTFNRPEPYSSGILGHLCKSMSQSQQLDSSRVLDPDLSLQMQNQLQGSVIIHEVAGNGSFDGRFLSLYEEMAKVFL